MLTGPPPKFHGTRDILLFEVDRRSPGEGKQAVIYARDKRRRPDKKPKPAPTSPRIANDSTSMPCGISPGALEPDRSLTAGETGAQESLPVGGGDQGAQQAPPEIVVVGAV